MTTNVEFFRALEESLWREETRSDSGFLDGILAGKFKEIHVMMWILTVLIIANQTGFIADLFG